MNKDIRKITDGAMMAAIIGAVLLINRQMAGMIESMFLWAFPLPMVFYGAKYGWKDSWMLYVSVILLTVFLGTPQTLFFVASEAMIGMVYGCGIYNKTATRRLVFRTLLMAVASEIIVTIIFASFFGYNPTAEMAEYQTALTEALAKSGQTLPANVDLSQMLKTVFVVSTILLGVMEGMITHFLSRIMLKRLHFNVEPLQPAITYFPPKWSGYLGLAGVMLFYWSTMHPFEAELVQNIAQGLGLCGMFYLAMYGLIAIVIFVRMTSGSKLLPLVAAILLMLISSLLVVIAGFMYITTDWHDKLLKGVTGNASEN